MIRHDTIDQNVVNFIEIQNETGRPITVQVRQSPHTHQMRIVIDESACSLGHGTEIAPNRVTFAPVYPGLS